MYSAYYKQLSTVADQIREGAYKGETLSGPAQTPALFKRPEKEEKDTGNDITNTLVGYMAALRASEPVMQGAPQGRSGGAQGGGLMSSVQGPLEAAREALAGVESGGRYDAVGPVVESGSYAGQRAYGRYQVMEGNIGPWTKEILGRSYSTQEFLNDKQAQDAVVEYRLQQSRDKHGTWEDAASVWFSGRPISRAGNASDGYNTVPEYVQKFQGFFNRYSEGLNDEPLIRRPA